MKRVLLCSILVPFLYAATSVEAAEPIDLSELTYDEQQQFLACRERGMMDAQCESLAQKTCSFPSNSDAWFCMDFNFNRCKKNDYQGSQCQDFLKRVCDATNDGFDVYCDRYRYEVCLGQEFVGQGCGATRLRFALPRVRNSIDGFLQSSDVRGKFIVDKEDKLKEYYCTLGQGDKASPLFSYCGSPTEVLQLAEFSDFYRDSENKPNSAEIKAELYEALLRGVPSTNPWDRIEANSVWVTELENSDGNGDPAAEKLLGYAARVLAEHGDDSVAATFLLLEASRHSLPEVRVAAMDGLGNRRYSSGLALLALMKGMMSDVSAEKAAAMTGIGKRWQADVNSTYNGRLDQKKLGSLFDCRSVKANSRLYSSMNTLEDAAKIDLMSPQNICAIGMGAQLQRTKNSVWNWLEQQARSPSAEGTVRAAALRALGRLAFASSADRETARKVATDVFAEPAREREVVMGALDLLSSVSTQNPTPDQRTQLFAEIMKAMREEISVIANGSPDATDAESRLGNALALFVRHDFLPAEGTSDERNTLSALSPILAECVENMSLPFAVRTQCFSAANSAESFRLESAMFPQIVNAVSHGITSERKAALTLIEQGVFLFLDKDLNFGNVARMAELGHATSSHLIGMIEHGLTADIEYLATTLGSLRRISVDSEYYKKSPELRSVWECFSRDLKNPAAEKRLANIIDHLYPRMTASPVQLNSWLDAYKTSKKDVVVMRSYMKRGERVSGYFLREDLQQVLLAHLREKMTMEDALVLDFAWEPWKALFLIGAGSEETRVPEYALMKLLWAVDHPDKTEEPGEG